MFSVFQVLQRFKLVSKLQVIVMCVKMSTESEGGCWLVIALMMANEVK